MRKMLHMTAACLMAVLLLTLSAVAPIGALEPSGNGVEIRNWVTNDPEYTFSDAYKTSVWYQNFSSLSLTENQRNNVLRIAVSQLGYHEGNSPEDFDGMNQAGGNNYIEYARLIVPNYNNNSYEWCACFVNWCLNQARIDYCYGEISCWKWVEWLKANKMFENSAAYKGTYTPQPADMIFFNWDGVNTGASHIGYVLYVTEDTVYTIEGNSSDEVGIRSYAINNPCIIGYGTPPYEEGNEATLDYSYAGGMPSGVYVVTTANISLTGEPAKAPRLDRLKLGSTVELVKEVGDYALVYANGQAGYVEKQHLCLMTLGYVASFMADGQVVSEIPFIPGAESLSSAPVEVPEKQGYTGEWESYSVKDATGDFIVKAVYTPIEYTVTFEADGQAVGQCTYTVDDKDITPPEVPQKDGYTGVWETYALTTGDVTVTAVYSPASESSTETGTLSGTDSPESSTDAASQTATEPTTSGCASVAGFSALLLLVPAVFLGLKKKKDAD